MTTSPGQVAGATQEAAGQTATTAKDEAVQVGQVAASAASDVAGTAKRQAGQVAGEAVNQLRSLTDDARSQAAQQVSGATDRLSASVRSYAGELRDLGQGKGDPDGAMAGLVQQLADAGETLADHIARTGPSGLVQDLRSFAARRPGTFLLGALAAGIVTGRLVKGAAADSGASGPSATYGTPGTGTGGYAGVPAYETDLAVAPVATAPPVSSVPPVTASSSSYLDDVPVTYSDDAAVLDTDVDSAVGPVSGDDRLRVEGRDAPGLGTERR